MLVALALAALTLLLYAAPDVAGLKALHRILVVQPARYLSRLGPAKILFLLSLGVIAWALIGLFAGEGVKLFTMMAPDTILWFAMFDVATIMDALIFGLVVSSSVRLSAALKRAQAILAPAREMIARLIRRAGRARTPTTAPPRLRKPSRADDPDRGWLQNSPAAYAWAG